MTLLFVLFVALCVVCFISFFVMFFFFKQKTAYEMRISDWSSDVCSSDLLGHRSLLDEFGGLSAELVAVEHAFGAWREAGERLAALRDEQIGRASCRERVCE